MQNKTRLELADYEAENLAKLQKMFSRKWEFIFMQAEAQSKVDKKRDKLERKVLDSQERAFWDVYRPMVIMFNSISIFRKLFLIRYNTIENLYNYWFTLLFQPGCVNTTEMDIKKACRTYKPISKLNKHLDMTSTDIPSHSESFLMSSVESLNKEIEILKARLDRSNIKVSKVSEA